MNIAEIKKILEDKTEPAYREFSGRLINGSSLPLLGVRLPALKRLAKEICAAGSGEEFLSACDFSSIEMSLLYSYVLGRTRGDTEKLLPLFDRAAARVDNWCTCDILCQSFRQCEKDRERVWRLLISYLDSGKTFYMRIAVVMMMSHYLTDGYADRVLEVLNNYSNDGYYYKMGAAWCAATAMAKFPDRVFVFLEKDRLDDWTHNKAIQKMIESRRVSDEDKERLRSMKR